MDALSSNRDFKENPRLITEAKGVYLKNHHGKTMIDASSGLFCNPLGHGRKEITNAVAKQLEQLDYVQPFQQGFGGSFELARRISKHTPGNLNRIFYTICGSTAVETAIKIVIAYHKAKGQGQRFRFVGRERAYHGMNIGATSVGGMINNIKTFASVLMPGVVHMRHTHLPEHKFVSGQPETGAELANDLERICANFGGENIAACIVEPIAGSTGTLVPPTGYLQTLREICDKHGILLIFDEVQSFRIASGGAQEVFNVVPDLTALGKVIGGGLPVGAFGGKNELMALYDPTLPGGSKIPHAGTFNGNPMTMVAGQVVMNHLTDDSYVKMNHLGDILRHQLESVFDEIGFDTQITGIGSLFGIHFSSDPINDYRSIINSDQDLKKALFFGLLNEGVLLQSSCAGALNILSTEDDVSQLIDSVRRVAIRLKNY